MHETSLKTSASAGVGGGARIDVGAVTSDGDEEVVVRSVGGAHEVGGVAGRVDAGRLIDGEAGGRVRARGIRGVGDGRSIDRGIATVIVGRGTDLVRARCATAFQIGCHARRRIGGIERADSERRGDGIVGIGGGLARVEDREGRRSDVGIRGRRSVGLDHRGIGLLVADVMREGAERGHDQSDGKEQSRRELAQASARARDTIDGEGLHRIVGTFFVRDSSDTLTNMVSRMTG